MSIEKGRAYLRQRAKKLRKKVSFLLPFRSDRSLKENIRAFLDSRRHREGPVTAGGPDGEAPASPPEGPAPEDPGFEKNSASPERGEPVPQPESLPEDPAGESAKAAGRAECGGPALQPEGRPGPDFGGSLKDPIHGVERGDFGAVGQKPPAYCVPCGVRSLPRDLEQGENHESVVALELLACGLDLKRRRLELGAVYRLDGL